jgi:TATA-box binding protein (TBP) (component of TFIID and TFIIIB)
MLTHTDELTTPYLQFETIPVSTQTFTVRTNLFNIDLQSFFDNVQTPSTPLNNTIVYIKYQKLEKGINQNISKNTKKQCANKGRNFLNCITLIIIAEKKINVKIFKNGVFQLTGCKSIHNVKTCINVIFLTLKTIPESFSFASSDTNLVVYIKSAMRNIDFNLGFKINRDNMLHCLDLYSDFIIPPPMGNKMDIKIRILLTPDDIKNITILKISYPTQEETELKFKDCFEIIEPDEKKRKNKLENKFITISIFQNGKVLLSGVNEVFQKKYYIWLMDLTTKYRSLIEIKNEPIVSFLSIKNINNVYSKKL